MLEHTVLSVYVLPTQRREAGLVHASLRVHAQFLLLLSARNSSRVALCLPPHSDTPAPLSHPAVIQRCHNSTNFADGGPQAGNCPQFFFQIFLKSPIIPSTGHFLSLWDMPAPVLGFEDLWIGWSP